MVSSQVLSDFVLQVRSESQFRPGRFQFRPRDSNFVLQVRSGFVLQVRIGVQFRPRGPNWISSPPRRLSLWRKSGRRLTIPRVGDIEDYLLGENPAGGLKSPMFGISETISLAEIRPAAEIRHVWDIEDNFSGENPAGGRIPSCEDYLFMVVVGL